MTTDETLNELLVRLFKDIMEIEARCLVNEEFKDISYNDFHIIEAIGLKEPKSMTAVAKLMDVTTGTLTKDDTVTGAYTLSGGELIINGTTFNGTIAADTDAKKANGTITLNSVAKSGTVNGASYTAIAGTFSKLDLNLNVYNAASNGTKGDVTIGADSNDLTIKEGTLKTGTIEGSSTAANKVAGTATITGKNLAFGVAPDPVGDKGETSVTNPGFAYDFDNTADVTLNVTAKETVAFNKGTITNAGTMTVTGKTGVTVGKEVSIANTGDLTFKDDAKVDFKADYTASAGRLFIESADNTISGNITADSLKFGTRITDSDTAKETNQVVITGSTSNTIAYGSTVDVKALTVEDEVTTVKGALKAATTTIGAGKKGRTYGFGRRCRQQEVRRRHPRRHYRWQHKERKRMQVPHSDKQRRERC